jgi:hypothetical protein
MIHLTTLLKKTDLNWSYQVFIVCHTYRLAFRTFELAFPESAVLENYQVCEKEGRYHVPVKLF